MGYYCICIYVERNGLLLYLYICRKKWVTMVSENMYQYATIGNEMTGKVLKIISVRFLR